MINDPSWLHFDYGNKGAWHLPEDPNPVKDWLTIGVRKIMANH